MNAGVILFCRPRRYLAARVDPDEKRLRALAPDADVKSVRAHLDAIARIAAGDLAGGPIAALPRPERFHWLVAASSTIIQPSPVHTGMTDDPATELNHLFDSMVG